ncbi:MAG: hypothetical protein INQ03_05620 [Candidatus Heimdallarchaeota archaeon]|nr:hypothetical protein [Candidatus Heimdallarchaeota archaeon]
MSDPERYSSQGLYREEDLYYDLGFRFASSNGRKPMKAFSKDYTIVLLLFSFGIQLVLGISQLFSILALLFLFVMRYVNEERSQSPLFIIMVIVGHVYDYHLSGVVAIPGEIIQGKLTTGFWLMEMAWILVLAYQFLIIFQPYTPILAKNQSVKPATPETIEQYNKMRLRLEGSSFTIQPLAKLINIERLQQTLVNTSKLVMIIIGSAILIDYWVWDIIFSLGGGNNILEIYMISGMSLILFGILVGFSHLIAPDDEKEEDEDFNTTFA